MVHLAFNGIAFWGVWVVVGVASLLGSMSAVADAVDTSGCR